MTSVIHCSASVSSLHLPHRLAVNFSLPQTPSNQISAPCSSSSSSSAQTSSTTRRALLSVSTVSTAFCVLVFSKNYTCLSKPAISDFFELQNSGGVKALDLRIGDGDVPVIGNQVAIHYYGRLAAKQGWRFDSTYDHKDETGEPIPFVFTLGSGKVISGIETAVRSMKLGGIRRVIIPPSEGYQNTSQEPIPPNVPYCFGFTEQLEQRKKE